MKKIMIFFAVIVLAVFGLFFFANFGKKTIGSTRFMLYRADMENYLSDELYKNEIQAKGTSYFLTKQHLYTYGTNGFTIINLDTGEIKYLFDEYTNKWFKQYTAPDLAKEKRELEKLDTPYLIILTSENQLSETEKEIRKNLMNERKKYPLMIVSSGSK